MTKIEALAELMRLAERYTRGLSEAQVPNTTVALVDDFGEWLKKWRDDQ